MTAAHIDTEGFVRLRSDEAVYHFVVRVEDRKVVLGIDPGRSAITALVISRERVPALIKALEDALKELTP